MRSVGIPLLLLLPACYVGPVYKIKDKKKSCPTAMVERAEDLALKVDHGSGDGNFDYDLLDWPLVDHTRGEYDLKSGEFWWINDYAPDAVRQAEHAEGLGSVQRNGDLDLDYVLTVTWKDSLQTQFAVRHTRVGCVETLRSEQVDDPDNLMLSDMTWTGTGLDWVRNFVEGPVAVQGIGRMEADRSWAEFVDFSDGGVKVFWLTEGDGNGHQTRTFDDDSGLAKTVGSWERWFDGTVAMDFTYNRTDILRQTWQFSADAAGNGGGTWSTSEQSCELSFNEGKCRLKACTDPSFEGQCTVPVTWPIF